MVRGKGPPVRAHGCASSDRPAPCQPRRASARSVDVRQARMVLPTFAVTKVGRRRRMLLLLRSRTMRLMHANGFADFCRNKSQPPKAEAFALAKRPHYPRAPEAGSIDAAVAPAHSSAFAPLFRRGFSGSGLRPGSSCRIQRRQTLGLDPGVIRQPECPIQNGRQHAVGRGAFAIP